ncbi:YOD1, partial [Symbiodinium sp. CCMP2592]
LAAAIALSMADVAEKPRQGRMTRHVIDADNSCLFNSIAYALEGRATDKAPTLRETVAAIILSSPDVWTEVVLGKSPEEYADWIQDPEHWGGGIELAVLSDHYEAEIAAFDCQSLRVDIFGEGKGYQQRALLIYDGIHYDVLVREALPGDPEEVALFGVADAAALEEARQIAKAIGDMALWDLTALMDVETKVL